MTISWATQGDTATSTVKYGTSPDNMSLIATGTSKTYYGNKFFHHTTLEVLTPNTRYFYSCGDEDGGFSNISTFNSAPSRSDGASGTFSASIFGDWGYGENGNAIATRSALENLKEKVSLVWHLGDIAYADDAFLHDITGFEYENIYDSWMNWIQNITLPYMVAVGNHESECHSPACLVSSDIRESLQNFSAYNTRWKMPYKDSKSRSNMWYSYNYGLVHFVSINTETDFPGAAEATHGDSGLLPAGGFGRPGEYLEWLEQDLKDAVVAREAGTRPWIIAGGHRPVYDASKVGSEMQTAVEDLFEKYGVDLYFSGHLHSYARSLPVYKSVPESSYNNPNHTVYVVAGGAGCDEMHGAERRLDDSVRAADSNAVPIWNVYADAANYGTGVLHVLNETTLHWEYTISRNLEVADEFYLVKERTIR